MNQQTLRRKLSEPEESAGYTSHGSSNFRRVRTMKFKKFVFCAGVLLGVALTASAQTFDFNKDKAGGPPKGFSAALTGLGKAGVWVVTKDDSSPERGNVLAQTDADATGYRFPLCVHDGVTAKDAVIRVKVNTPIGRTP